MLRNVAERCGTLRSVVGRYGNVASAISDLFSTLLDHLRRIFCGLYCYAKFGWNPCSSFHDMNVLYFGVWLENAYLRPQINGETKRPTPPFP